uniref:Uncharacterized protein n=1 Tax=Oryza sativa subsp. japonica TaxID=39947 RepID=Q6Z0D5_ORYSJ|nr:hypothetical protein [Oryza sativa Japonica Group]BAD03673.1 hypothetical protein [Oryza sativa Japonica Group]
MAAGNFWVRYARRFLDFNLNLLITVELRMVLSTTPCLYGSHIEIDQSRMTTTPTSEVAIGYMSSFKQKLGATIRVTDKEETCSPAKTKEELCAAPAQLGKAAQLAVGCGAVEVCDHPVPVGSVKRHAPTPLDWANDAADVG